MSRIGKKPVKVNSASVEIKDDKIVVSGKNGTLEVPIFEGFDLDIVGKEIKIVKKHNSNYLNAKWGLLRSLVQNAILGVEEGFEKRLEMVGVGYRAQKSAKGIIVSAGFSHPVEFDAPEGIDISIEENTKIVVRGFDKQKVGQVASEIKRIRKPEPYKGKGIKYANETIRRKAGKAAKASA